METVHNSVKFKTITHCHTFAIVVNCFIILRLLQGTNRMQPYHLQIFHVHFCLLFSHSVDFFLSSTLGPVFVCACVCLSPISRRLIGRNTVMLRDVVRRSKTTSDRTIRTLAKFFPIFWCGSHLYNKY